MFEIDKKEFGSFISELRKEKGMSGDVSVFYTGTWHESNDSEHAADVCHFRGGFWCICLFL